MDRDQGRQVAPHPFAMGLRDISAGDVGYAGAKAANLGEMMQAGLPVPDGFVVTTAAFARFLENNGLGRDPSQEKVKAAPIPADVARAVLASFADFEDAAVAVRSSGVGEDLPGASFAGQYETFLGVRGDEALLDAVRGCWASAFNERVVAYRQGMDQQEAAMAVLVQRLVPADGAGVAFSANPVTGDRSEVVVSSVRGLGDRLVSGQASPDEWRVRGSEVTCASAPEQAITVEQVRAVAEMTRRVEAHYGVPQDIEWAIAGDELYLLQARPITALPDQMPEPIPVPVDIPEGYWEREGVHQPKPLVPMERSLIMENRNTGFREAFQELGQLMDGIEFREIGGWGYRRMVPPDGKDSTPPLWLMPLLARVFPPLRSRVKRFLELVRTQKELPYIEHWYKEGRKALAERTAGLREVDLSCLSDTALYEHISSRLLPFYKESFRYHCLLDAANVTSVVRLVLTCRELLGWDDARTMGLLSGLSEKSGEPARRLVGVAARAAESPAVRRLLEQRDAGSLGRFEEADPEFARTFEEYRREFGCQALQYSCHEPTLAEEPELLLHLVRDQVARNFNPAVLRSDLDERRAAAVAEARAALAERSAEDRERFERHLAGAELGYPVREDNAYYTDGAPRALLRYSVLEVGGRLVGRSQIEQRDDVFFLEMDEALSALRDGTSRRELVTRSKGERAWVEAHPGPASYGKDSGLAIGWLPQDAQRFTEGQLWATQEIFKIAAGGEKAASEAALCGVPASPGRYTGPVRVILNESEFSKLQANDVLVCPTTSPVWSILFPSVGALITDAGGMLSHPAIIAREYRVPAVVATGNATSFLSDGQTVTVDGSAGTVEVAA